MIHLILHPLGLMDKKVDVFSIQIFRTLFALTKIQLMSTLMVRHNGQLCYLFQMMHGIMSCFNSQFKGLIKCGISLEQYNKIVKVLMFDPTSNPSAKKITNHIVFLFFLIHEQDM